MFLGLQRAQAGSFQVHVRPLQDFFREKLNEHGGAPSNVGRALAPLEATIGRPSVVC